MTKTGQKQKVSRQKTSEILSNSKRNKKMVDSKDSKTEAISVSGAYSFSATMVKDSWGKKNSIPVSQIIERNCDEILKLWPAK